MSSPNALAISPTPTAPALMSASSCLTALSAQPGPTLRKSTPASTRKRSLCGLALIACERPREPLARRVVGAHADAQVQRVHRRHDALRSPPASSAIAGVAVDVDGRELRLRHLVLGGHQRRPRAVVEDARRRELRRLAAARTRFGGARRALLVRAMRVPPRPPPAPWAAATATTTTAATAAPINHLRIAFHHTRATVRGWQGAGAGAGAGAAVPVPVQCRVPGAVPRAGAGAACRCRAACRCSAGAVRVQCQGLHSGDGMSLLSRFFEGDDPTRDWPAAEGASPQVSLERRALETFSTALAFSAPLAAARFLGRPDTYKKHGERFVMLTYERWGLELEFEADALTQVSFLIGDVHRASARESLVLAEPRASDGRTLSSHTTKEELLQRFGEPETVQDLGSSRRLLLSRRLLVSEFQLENGLLTAWDVYVD